jgi:hypothetical protein
MYGMCNIIVISMNTICCVSVFEQQHQYHKQERIRFSPFFHHPLHCRGGNFEVVSLRHDIAANAGIQASGLDYVDQSSY